MSLAFLLPECCHIGSGMPYICIFVEDIVSLSGSMTDKWVYKFVFDLILKISHYKVKVAATNIKAKFIAGELSVKRVVSFGMELYPNK